MNFLLKSGFLFLLLLLCTCKSDMAKTSTEEFILREGYSIEQLAEDPLIQSPVAMTQDEYGRLWVVEMPGYMRDIDGNDEDENDGKIVILEDTNDDNIMDKRSIFADALLNPRAIALVYGGALYTNGTSLVWSAIENDKATPPYVVDSLYVVGGNIEHQPNGLYYNIDNWIYSAKSNTRYQRKNGKWIKEVTSFRGQWGISGDHLGRLVYNHNSAPLMGDRTIPNMLLDNSYHKISENVSNYYTDDMRLYPIQATAVNRGYEAGVLDSNEMLINYTSACSPLVYYGTGLSEEMQGNAFVCAPEANLISHYEIDHLTQSATKDSTLTEFLVSKEETFRPVALMTGYDDALYVLDMRKGIIQHTAYMSSYLRAKILSQKLDQVNGQGRIYKIKKEGAPLFKQPLNKIEKVDLPQLFHSKNLSTRIWAQQEIIRHGAADKTIINQLIKYAADTQNPIAALHAWWTLDGLDLLSTEMIARINQKEINVEFAIGILPLLKKIDTKTVDLQPKILLDIYRKMMALKNYTLDINLASNLGLSDNYEQEWWQLAEIYKDDIAMNEALISSTFPRLENLHKKAKKNKGYQSLTEVIEKCLQNHKEKLIQSPQFFTETFDDNRTSGLKKYKQYCAACHAYDGLGQKKMAPSLVESLILKGPEKEVARIILSGYDTGNKSYQIKMPAYIDNPNMTDSDISDIINYLNSTFAKKWSGIPKEDVAKIRKEILSNH